MTANPRPEWLSAGDYLALEATSLEKHEYMHGHRWLRQAGPYGPAAMAGATRAHVRLTMRMASLLDGHTTAGPCETYSTDMRLRVADDVYFYPDVFVCCSPDLRPEVIEQSDATVVVEVLSSGTEGFDFTDKFSAYQSLPSFAEYVLLSARQARADVYRRTPHGSWEVTTHRQGDDLVLKSVSFHVSMDDIYAGIRLLGAVSDREGL
jgi:Uma2 family endonuclease